MVLAVLFVALSINTYAANITSCGDDPNTSDYWVLTKDINASGDCIEFNSSRVILDCNFKNINGFGSAPYADVVIGDWKTLPAKFIPVNDGEDDNDDNDI